MRLLRSRSLPAGVLLYTVILAAIIPSPAIGQHQPHDSTSRKDTTSMKGMPGMKMPAKKQPPKKTSKPPTTRRTTRPAPPPRVVAGRDSVTMSMPTMPSMAPDPLGVSMERLGSGTTWIPDAVRLPSRRFMAGSWNMMFHGFVFGQYDHQSGPRGDDQVGSLNWGMLMASRSLAGGRFQVRTMLSLDPLTVTKRGYPLLLQSGETYRRQPLRDRQHPHDFWMELAAMYERLVGDRFGVMIYAAPSGEPALGPVAFMHRPSAMDNPIAPLAHHWQDATHVSFGVITAGLFMHRWKLEASAFNGREPDEDRWNFDSIRLDSYSARLTLNPAATWSFSAAYGYLESPEELRPEERMHRITASALHGMPVGSDGQWSSALIWGANRHSSTKEFTHSVTAESEAILDHRNSFLARAEFVQKSAEDLVLNVPPFNFPADRTFNAGAIGVGYIRELVEFRGATLGVGGIGTLNFVPSELERAYGSRNPTGLMLFLRLRPIHQHPADMMPMHRMRE